MDITLESSVESFVAVGVSLAESDDSQQLVGVILESSVDDDPVSESVMLTSPSLRLLEADSQVAEDKPLPFYDLAAPVTTSTPVKQQSKSNKVAILNFRG